jgi:hypothetical protein
MTSNVIYEKNVIYAGEVIYDAGANLARPVGLKLRDHRL